MKSKPIIQIVLAPPKYEKADATYPLKLRVTFERNYRLYGIKIQLSKQKPGADLKYKKLEHGVEASNNLIINSLTAEDFKKVYSDKPREPFREIRERLDAIKTNANDIANELKDFDFDTFAARFTGKRGEPGNVFKAFLNKIEGLNNAGQIGTAVTYSCAHNSLKEYHTQELKRGKLMFDDITVKYLKDYEAYLTRDKAVKRGGEIQIKQGASVTTVSMYVRCLRALHNEAIRSNAAKPENYPFGLHKYEIPAPRNIKKALRLSDIKKIFEYSPATTTEAKYRDLWLFSYLCNGANIKDLILLKYSDIDENSIVFRREKTAKTNKKQRPIVAANTEKTKAIIDRWGNKPEAPEKYIFPYLEQGVTPQQIRARTQDVTKRINKKMAAIGKSLAISAPILTYSARHSFASILKNSGVPVQFISESLGHSNMTTTTAYLDSLEDSSRAKIAENLTNFEKLETTPQK